MATNPDVQDDALLHYREAAALLAISEKSLQRLVKAGKITPTPVGVRSIRFKRSELTSYAEKQTAFAALTASVASTRRELAAAGIGG